MDNKFIENAQLLLLSDDLANVMDTVGKTDDNALLYFYVNNYNWNDGFEIPTAIMNNPNVQPAVLLMLFYRADGMRVILNPAVLDKTELKIWPIFIRDLMKKLDDVQKTDNIYEYRPEMSKVEMFKGKKASPDLPEFYFTGFPGVQPYN